MLIDEWHYDFDIHLDKVASQDKPDFYDNERDVYFKKAINAWTKDRYGSLNRLKNGFETNQERISNLMSLHIKYPVQPALTPTDLGGGLYELQLSNLSFPYLFLTSAKVTIKKGVCTETIDHTAWQIDDRKNTYNEPSFDWSRVHANFGRSSATTTTNSELYSIYFDTNDVSEVQQFTITSVQMNYIKTPDRVCRGTYRHIDDLTTVPLGANSPVVHCDIPAEFHDEIINLAVQMAYKDIQDQFGYQTSMKTTESDK